MEIPVKKLFWDALEIALEAQTHRLAKDIAAVLGTPDAPLLKALKEEKIRVRLVEDSDDIDDLADHRCTHYHQVGPVWRVCGEPVLWRSSGDQPTTVCPYHALHPCPAAPGPPVQEVEIEDEGTFFVNRETKAVYTQTGDLCGRLSEEGGRIELFDVAPTN
jgi:hypothetical protein